MREWWEYRGVCSGCGKPVLYGEQWHVACTPRDMDTSWQRRVNLSNERWRPGYRFKTEKNSGYRTYQCFYSVDRNGCVKFDGGVRARNEAQVMAEWQAEVDAMPAGNWYEGCEL